VFMLMCVLWLFTKKLVFFCVLRYVFCVRVLSVFFNLLTHQKLYKANKIRYAQYSAIRCCASFSHSEMSAKIHSQNTRTKHCKTPAKHRKTLLSIKHSKKNHKTPQKNTRETPQNTKHHNAHLLTKQTELANKPLRRSHECVYTYIDTDR